MDSWQHALDVFDHVADLAPIELEQALARECAGAPPLRAKVERLLKADHQPNPLDHDIVSSASRLLLVVMKPPSVPAVLPGT